MIEISQVYIFEYDPKADEIVLTYRKNEYSGIDTLHLRRERKSFRDTILPEGVDLLEFYEWLQVKLFPGSIPSSSHQTYPSESCSLPSQDASLSLLS